MLFKQDLNLYNIFFKKEEEERSPAIKKLIYLEYDIFYRDLFKIYVLILIYKCQTN